MTDTPLTAAEEFAASVEPASDALCGAAWQWFVNGPGVDNPKRPTIWALLSRIEHDRATIAALTTENATLKAALAEIAGGVDHPKGIQGAPAFYEAVEWAQGIARLARYEEGGR